jgi:hypothetical protein
MTVLAASTTAWAVVRQLPCDPADKGQIFSFDRL